MTALVSPALVDHLTSRLPEMLADLEALVTCESPSTDNEALARCAAVVAAQGTRLLGTHPELLERDGRTHLRWRFGSGERRALVLGHHDTVWPVGTLETLPWTVSDGVARGPGCFDMKAGLVVAFHALAALADLDGLSIVLSADEELGSPTAVPVILDEAQGCAAAFVTEPSADGGALKTSRKGTGQFEIAVRGRAAHAGLEPDRGVNAAVELAHQVLAVSALADPAVGTTVTPTVCRAGSTVNTVPGEAMIAVDVRAPDRGEQERVTEAINALRPRLPGAQLRVTSGMSAPPLEEARSAPLFRRAQALAADLGLGGLRGAAVGGGSDGNHVAAAGIPTLDGLGAVGGGAHAPDEHVIVAELPRRAALLAALAESVLA